MSVALHVRSTCRVAHVQAPQARRASRRKLLLCRAALEEALDAQTRFKECSERFRGASDVKQRLALLLQLGKELPRLPEDRKTPLNRVMGCVAQVWVTVELTDTGSVVIGADSDSEISRGLAAVLVNSLSGLTPEEIDAVDPRALAALDLGPALASASRVNSFRNMFESIKKRARAAAAGDELPRFPSLLVTADALLPRGAFAEAQAAFLEPRPTDVERLVQLLQSRSIGVVAHFYMDPQVQGVLSSAAARWPHIAISDSLVMADTAVRMADAGCKYICVLGVDFMSENVRAILDDAGHMGVGVYRMAAAEIGCSLAEAAESPQYDEFLAQAAQQARSMHVIYINTSLRTKALAHAAVPTVTCTSSNVVQTVLQGFAQIPDLHVWYGPDTYMGRNLQQLMEHTATLPDEEVQALHRSHTQASVRALLPRLHHFQHGTCIVHHMFGGATCELVRKGYSDAFIAAHFEVPGEMFSLAMEAKRERDMGVVGSTSNILDFIAAKVKAAIERGFPDRVQVVLGTEVGMITSIVRKVQGMLKEAAGSGVELEVVFPVNAEAIVTSAQQTSSGPVTLPGGLSVIPGPASGEGCSQEGGCAACPYMKMNSLEALFAVCERCGSPAGEAMLEAFKPKAYSEQIRGQSIARAGCEPILHMRDFQRQGKLSDRLLQDIVSRHGAT